MPHLFAFSLAPSIRVAAPEYTLTLYSCMCSEQIEHIERFIKERLETEYMTSGLREESDGATLFSMKINRYKAEQLQIDLDMDNIIHNPLHLN